MMWRLIPVALTHADTLESPVVSSTVGLALSASGCARIVRDPPLLNGRGYRDHIAERQSFGDTASLSDVVRLAREIIELLAVKDLNPFHFQIARQILEEESTHAEWGAWAQATLMGAEVRGIRVLDHLVRLLVNEIYNVSSKLLSILDDEILRIENGILKLDAVFLHWCAENLGLAGDTYATLIQERAQERMVAFDSGKKMTALKFAELFSLWVSPEIVGIPARWPRGLCRIIWKTHVFTEYNTAHKRIPVVTGPTANSLLKVYRPGIHLEESHDKVLFCDKEGVQVGLFQQIAPSMIASVQMGVAEQLAMVGAGLLGNVNAHRLLDWMIPTVHARALAGEADARVLNVTGGWTALAEHIGIKSKRAAEDLHAIVAAMAHLAIQLPDGSMGNLLAYRDIPARGRHPGRLEIVVGTALMPNSIYSLQGEDRILIPWPPPIPLVGRTNEHGAQRALRLKVLIEFRKNVSELAKFGGIAWKRNDWKRFASDVNLPEQMLEAVLSRWLRDGEDGPAFLKQIEPERYMIGDAHFAIRVFLEEAAKLISSASAAGKRSILSKKKRLARVHR